MAINTITERLRIIQRRLGLTDDGILGPVTLSRIESLVDQVLGVLSDTAGEYSLAVSRRALEQIVQFEISSDAYYRRFLSHPTWPGGESGVTIGVGYDLGYHPASQVRSDWKGRIADAELDDLMEVAGLKKEAARDALAPIERITIPLEAAKEVFYTSTLPRYAQMTRKAYPGVEQLPADAQGMLLSLVFNRGTRMSGGSRQEMKAIQPLVIAKDLNGISEQIRSMKRLWDPDDLPGLHKRRDAEAKMIADARTDYDPSELFRV